MKSRLDKNSSVLNTPVAHRGLHNENYPENSMAAFKNAIDRGYPIEMDVHMSSDGKLVVFHDDNLSRMTGYNADIREVDYQTIQSLRLKNTDEVIPDFSDFLALVGGRVPLLIEVKQQKQKGIEQKIIDELKEYNGEFVVQSFDPRIVINFKKLAPEIIRGQLACGYKQGLGFAKEFVLKHTPLNFLSKPDFVNYDIGSLPTKRSRYGGLPLICWTVRTEEQKKKAESLGINYVFENVFK
ncbi:MAG: glycerophosphodiester phosphodiesterase [Clostridia bacterium]|nr:glycerophosphodiester phosphodiesterase [Clostridia bacterium]